MKISIGILAYNESEVIGKMLNSLWSQTIFQETDSQIEQIEIIVVPNGCTDDTATVARQVLKELPEFYRIDFQVHELNTPGKSNAWNTYVHELADITSDYIFLIDSDIEFLEECTLQSMLETLEKNSNASVAVDRPIKDVALKKDKNLMEHLSALVSKISGNKTAAGEPAWICGQLYCARAEALRKIWLPLNIINDDSFIYTNIVTECLTTAVNPYRVLQADSASHIFEAYTDLSRLLRHERWLIVGSAINELIYQDLQHDSDRDVALEIKQRNEKNQYWVQELIQNQTLKQGWLIPKFILIRRFLSLGQKPIYKSLILFPFAFSAFILDAWLAFRANQELRRGRGLGYWGK